MWWGGRVLYGDTVWGYRVPFCIPYPYPPLERCYSGWVGSVLGLWYGLGMSDGRIKDILALTETWPLTAQEELVAIVREIDSALKGGLYHATPDELAGIDRGLAAAKEGGFATEAELAALMAKWRQPS